jgi:hypothetical protein
MELDVLGQHLATASAGGRHQEFLSAIVGSYAAKHIQPSKRPITWFAIILNHRLVHDVATLKVDEIQYHGLQHQEISLPVYETQMPPNPL